MTALEEWIEQGRAFSAKELESVGITLPYKPDWADILASDLFHLATGPHCEAIDEIAPIIRARCLPRPDLGRDTLAGVIADILDALNRQGPASDIRAGLKPLAAINVLRDFVAPPE